MQPLKLWSWWRYQCSRSDLNDYFLVTLPSSGTHWLRTMLAQALIESFQLKEEITGIRQDDLIPTFLDKNHRFKYNSNERIPRIQHSHSPYYWIFKDKKVLLLVRDLRTTLVSHYRVARNYLKLSGNFSQFIRGETINTSRNHDLTTRIKLLNSWSTNNLLTRDFMVIRYEDLQLDISTTILKAFNFLGIPYLDDNKINKIIESASMENMKIRENIKDSKAAIKITGKPSIYTDYFEESDKRYF